MIEFLKKVPLFSELPDTDISLLSEMAEEAHLSKGEELFAEGSPGNEAYVIREGELDILKESGGRDVLLAVRKAGEVIGEMALLEDAPRMASVRARRDTRLIVIHQDQLEHLLDTSPSAARALMQTVLARLRSTTSMLRQSEKMAQLGTLTAGVAHELNNPAAAVKRGAGQLESSLSQYEAAIKGLSNLNLTDAQKEKLDVLIEEVQQEANPFGTLDSLTRSDLEYELEEWLEEEGIENPWNLAPALVDLGYDTSKLTSLREDFTPDQLPAVVSWLNATYSIRDLLNEIGQGAERISEIVKSLKTYSYLDQAPVQEVDIHEGLDSTLVILRNKLKEGISVRREYDPDLPKIQAYGSELNQVWTNIIDNAIDALDGDGEITLRTQPHNSDWVLVEIIDNGPGIPPEIQSRIFDAFFTTKAVGKGTGLGLDISYKIVVDKHRGDIKVFSRPGKTNFQIYLPINFEKEDNQLPAVDAIQRMDDQSIRRILERSKTIAVVGLSGQENRPAHSVPAYLKSQGYRIIPVNPNYETLLGEKSYPNLQAISEPVDVVQIFRKSEFIPPIVDDAIQIGADVVWMQEGIVNESAAQTAREAGLDVVMDMCMRVMHRRLMS